MIDDGRAANSVVEYIGCQLHVEGYCVCGRGITTIHHGYFFKDGLYLHSHRIFVAKPKKIVRQDLRFDHFELNSYPLVVARNHKKIIQKETIILHEFGL